MPIKQLSGLDASFLFLETPEMPMHVGAMHLLELALNITVQSFDAHMDFGLMADAAALPDVKALALALDAAMEELRALPVPAKALTATRPQHPPKKAAFNPHATPAQKVSRTRRTARVTADANGALNR